MKIPSIERWDKLQVSLSEGKLTMTTFPLELPIRQIRKTARTEEDFEDKTIKIVN